MNHKEDRSIGKWISIIHRQSQIYINKSLKQYGINSSEYIFLVNLASCEGVNQKYLSDILCIDEALTTRVIRNLEKKEYVIREKNLEDKRAYEVRLSPKGREVQPVILDRLKDWTNILSEGMNEEQVNASISMLKLMADNAIMRNREE